MGLTALLLYYFLHWIYTSGDQAESSAHAVRRTWWNLSSKVVSCSIPHSLYIIMFGASLTLAASVVFLVRNAKIATAIDEDISDPVTIVECATHPAVWVSSISLAVTHLYIAYIALLNKSLDDPRTLIISSRWVRLALRVPAIAPRRVLVVGECE